jgi:hypothetical protein
MLEIYATQDELPGRFATDGREPILCLGRGFWSLTLEDRNPAFHAASHRESEAHIEAQGG